MKTALKAFIVATLALAGCSMSATADNPEIGKYHGEIAFASVYSFTVDEAKCVALFSGINGAGVALSCNWEKK